MRNAAPFSLLGFLTMATAPWAAGLSACTGPNSDACVQGPEGQCEDSDQDLGMGGGGDDGGGWVDGDMATKGGGDGGVVSGLDPSRPGPYLTVQFDVEIKGTKTNITQGTVVGPSGDGATISTLGAPYPLVVFAPGYNTDRKIYYDYAERLATYGIITVLEDVARTSEYDANTYRDETKMVIDWMLAPSGTGADRLTGRVDGKRIGLAGHDLGGKIGLLVAAADKRVGAYFGIDPVDYAMPYARDVLSQIKFPAGVPLGLIGETISKMGRGIPCTPADSNYEILYGKALSPAFSITFNGVAHNDFIANCTTLCTMYCPGGMMKLEQTNKLAVKYTTAYFLWTLAKNADAEKFLDGDPFQKDVSAGYVTRVAK